MQKSAVGAGCRCFGRFTYIPGSFLVIVSQNLLLHRRFRQKQSLREAGAARGSLTGTQKKKSGFFFGLLRTIRPDVGPSTQQKLHIRKDHIRGKNFGKKKMSNRHAFTGELAVKLEHFWLL